MTNDRDQPLCQQGAIWVSVQYVRGMSEAIGKTLRPLGLFHVTMGRFDGAEVCEHLGASALSELSEREFPKMVSAF